MSDGIPTIASALGIEVGRPFPDHVAKLRTTACFTAIATFLSGHPPGAYWSAAATHVSDALAQALQQPITTLLAAAWNRYRPFLKYCDAKRYPPETSIEETLLTHTIRSTLQPRVRVFLDGDHIGDVNFEATIEIELEGGILTIQGGRFRELRPGRCSAGGTLKCEQAEIVKLTSQQLPLPGVVKLGDGIPIAPWAVEAHA